MVSLSVRANTAVGIFSPVVGNWKLAAGHWIPAKMSPVIVYPRPDTETQVWEVCRRWPSGKEWRIPIRVQGGARPFLYEVTNAGGSGAVIGQQDGSADYGILRIPNPVVGTYIITVAITDQDLVTIPRTFTLEVIDRESTAHFVWIATTGNNGNNGSFSSPKLNHAGWYGANGADATNQGKQVHFRGGTYLISAAPLSGSAGQQCSMTNVKPMVFSAHPGETVIFDGQDTAYFDISGISGGAAYCGIRWQNPSVPEGGGSLRRKQMVRLSGGGPKTRALMFENFYDGGGDTRSDDGSNSSCVMFADQFAYGQYGVVSHCTFHRCDNMDFVLLYKSQFVVVEDITVTGGYGGTFNPSWGVFVKGAHHDHITIARGTMIGTGNVRPLVHMSEFTNELKTQIEVCWCNGRATHNNGRASGTVALGQGTSGTVNAYGPFWSYRNNWYVDHFEPTALQDGPFTFENDCIQHSGVYTNGFNPVDNAQATMVFTNLATATSGMFDATTNLLIGTSRTSFLGTHGSEVS